MPFAGIVAGLPSRPADVVVRNAKIFTGDAQLSRATAPAATAGVIETVGGDADIAGLIGTDTMVVDVMGRRVVSGLNDPPDHVVCGGLRHTVQWVRVAAGWSVESFAEHRMPTRAESNEVAPDTPVIVTHLYQAAILNRAALKAARTSRGTPALPGGCAAVTSLHAAGEPTVGITHHLFPQTGGGEVEDLCRWIGMVRPEDGDAWLRFDGAGENLTWAAADFEKLAAKSLFPGGNRRFFDHAETISTQSLDRRETALAMCTSAGAALTGKQDAKDLLRPGHYADLMVLSDDDFAVPEDEIPTIEALFRVAGGRIVYATGEFEGLAAPATVPEWSPIAQFGAYQAAPLPHLSEGDEGCGRPSGWARSPPNPPATAADASSADLPPMPPSSTPLFRLRERQTNVGPLILRLATRLLMAVHRPRRVSFRLGGHGQAGGTAAFRRDGFLGGALTVLVEDGGQLTRVVFLAGALTPSAFATAKGVMTVAVTVKWANGPWAPARRLRVPRLPCGGRGCARMHRARTLLARRCLRAAPARLGGRGRRRGRSGRGTAHSPCMGAAHPCRRGGADEGRSAPRHRPTAAGQRPGLGAAADAAGRAHLRDRRGGRRQLPRPGPCLRGQHDGQRDLLRVLPNGGQEPLRVGLRAGHRRVHGGRVGGRAASRTLPPTPCGTFGPSPASRRCW
jgi:hypothetical protein